MSYHWIPQRDQHLPPHFSSPGRLEGNEVARTSPILQTSDFSDSVLKHLSNTAHEHPCQLSAGWMTGKKASL